MLNLANAVSSVRNGQQQPYSSLRLMVERDYPDTLKALRLVDMDCSRPRRGRGFNLVKREHKKTGFVYYVRYYHDGMMLPSKWNTHTNDLESAERFARENRERLVRNYTSRHDGRMRAILDSYYRKGSEYLACEERRNRRLAEKSRESYHAVIVKKFMPFLESRGITGLGGVSTKTLGDFQDRLLSDGMRPQTVNDNLKPVRRMFLHLARKGLVVENPCLGLRSIPVLEEDQEVRGCYEIGRPAKVFRREWKDRLSYLLCLLIYTTGMRNGEIGGMRMSDIVKIEGCHFVDIKKSKTRNGVRLVPLHPFVHGKIKAHARGRDPAAPLFDFPSRLPYSQANLELARRLGVGEEERKAENITFYSGRHYWKTLMSSEGLGDDVEELFMGHKVSGDVAKRYNHRDRQGKKLMAKKARQVFAILDRHIFARG